MNLRLMQKRTMTIAVAIFLMLAIGLPLATLPSAEAQLTRVTYAYMGAMPNPVGLGQDVLLHFGITHPTAWPQSGWVGMTIKVTRPDNTTETLGPFNTDPTGGAGTLYVPSMTGIYKFQSVFPEQLITTTAYDTPAGSTMLASVSEILELRVQAEPLVYYPGSPLPSEYWTRPIDAQHREWNAIAGNWLGYFRGTDASPSASVYNALYTTGPESGHILWSKPLVLGGIAGGIEKGPQSYDHGDAYEGRWGGSNNGPVVIDGKLFYNRHQSNGAVGLEQEVVAVDLRTGETLWIRPLIAPDGTTQRLNFGQVFYYDNFNQHSVYAYLWATAGSTWHAFDPLTGRWQFSLANVPSGNNIYGPDGNIYRHTVNLNRGWMTQWNLSKVIEADKRRLYGAGYDTNSDRGSWIRNRLGNTLNAGDPLALDYNVTIPRGLPGTVRKVRDGVILGSNFARGDVAPDPASMWAIGTKKGTAGQLIFNVTWDVPLANVHMSIEDANVEDDVFHIAVQETTQLFGFSLSTGQKIWGPTASQSYQDQYGFASGNRWDVIYNGKVYSGNWGGVLYCYDSQTGQLLWTYTNEDPYSDILWGNNWPIRISFIADGKIYLEHHEHSPVDPLPRGAPFVCLDAETGEEIFKVNLRATEWGSSALIADGIIAMFNTYDGQIYAVGKGPSKTTVTAPDTATTMGTPIVIKGYVTDVSAGTMDSARSARFPNGVAAVSDESMSDWMKYVYLQFPRPMNTLGVEVTLSVLDANGNYRDIGTTTSDANGFFSFMWTPDIPGKFTVYASFTGSKSYWPSFAETAFAVAEAPPPAATPEPIQLPPTDMYILYATIVIVVTIVIVGLLLLRKK